MGAKYSSQAISGYNASPPSDDGTQAASNLVSWATEKTKLADPIKTLAESINTALVAAMNYSVRQITSSDSVVAGDHMRTVEIAPTVSSAVTCTVTLADAATMTSTFMVRIKNSCPVSQTIARATGGDTIDGTAANITIPAGGSIALTTNAAANGYLILATYNWDLQGTWTPAQGSGLSLVGGFSSSGKYTKVGRMVFVDFTVSGATSVACSSNGQITSNLPFTVGSFVATGACGNATGSVGQSAYGNAGTTNVYLNGPGIAATAGIFVSLAYSV